MKMPTNTTFVDQPETSDRHASTSQRSLVFVLIALPCLMIVFGLLTGTLIKPDASNIIYGMSGYVPTAIVLVLLVLSYYLLRNNPNLRRASLWTFRSYSQSVAGLDERERLVVDQAFRTAYRIIVLAFVLALACAVINVQTLHLLYHPTAVSLFYIMGGIFALLLYLPMALVAWKEN